VCAERLGNSGKMLHTFFQERESLNLAVRLSTTTRSKGWSGRSAADPEYGSRSACQPDRRGAKLGSG
jgi:hypothetical protein